jgi:hypothetical protein
VCFLVPNRRFGEKCVPTKPNRVTVRVASLVVECLYHGKKICWARVFEEVIEQQARLLGPKNVGNSLPGYLVYLGQGDSYPQGEDRLLAD